MNEKNTSDSLTLTQRRRFTPEELDQAETIEFSESIWERPQVRGFTIDGETSLDLDDAIWIEIHGDRAKIQVHITDPTELIELNSPIDKGVHQRVETLYLSYGNQPMLPRDLSEGKLSLFEGKPRPTITVEAWIKSTAEVEKVNVFESWLCNHKQFTYAQVDQVLDDSTHPDYLSIQYCWIWAKILNQSRQNLGSFANTNRSQFYLDEEGKISTQPRYNSQQVIAEFMILANRLVAQWLLDNNVMGLWRNHRAKADAPDNDVFLQALMQLGDEQLIRARLQQWLDKALYEAYCDGHFALALDSYCHFTSPLRRGSDFIIHRLIKAKLRGETSPYTQAELEEIAESFNTFTEESTRRRKEYMKRKSLQELASKASQSLAALNQREFSRFIEAAIKTKKFAELREELIRRLQYGMLTPKDLCLLIFKYQDEVIKESLFEAVTLKNVTNLVGNAAAVVHEVSQVDYLDETKNPPSPPYILRLVVVINSKKLTTLYPSQASNKKDARNQAAMTWVKGFVNQQLVPVSESLELPEEPEEVINNDQEPEITWQEPEYIELVDNPVGSLNNLCQQLGISAPKYTYSNSANGFECHGQLYNLDGEIISASGKGRNKKHSKQIAANELLKQLDYEGEIENFSY